MNIVQRASSIEPFRVMEILARAKELECAGKKVLHLEIGEPDFPPPQAAIEAAQRALSEKRTRYTPAAGLAALREGIARWYRRCYGVDVDPARILITPGTSGAFVALYGALLDPGDRVLLPDPGYPCQKNLVRLVGGVPVLVPVDATTHWQLAPELIYAHWDARTKAAVVISPGNPTGACVPREQLAALAEAVLAKGGVLIVDEIYQQLVYEAEPWTALALSDRIVVIDGFSKRWALTGFRVGWLVVPEALIAPCERILQNAFIAAPTIGQYAALAALDADAELAAMRSAYDRRRRLLLDALPRLGFEIAAHPEGAFYIWARVDGLADDAERFCRELLEEVQVAVTPGVDFAAHEAHRYLRFSYAAPEDDISAALDKISSFLQKHGKGL